jgi:hypothetical protein
MRLTLKVRRARARRKPVWSQIGGMETGGCVEVPDAKSPGLSREKSGLMISTTQAEEDTKTACRGP